MPMDANEAALRRHEALEDAAQRFRERVDRRYPDTDPEEAIINWADKIQGDNADHDALVAAYRAADYEALGRLVSDQIAGHRRLLAEIMADDDVRAETDQRRCGCARCHC